MLAEFNGYTMKVPETNIFTWRRENEKHGCESWMLYDQRGKRAPGGCLGDLLGMKSYPVMWDYEHKP